MILHLGVDGLPLGEGLVEGQLAEHGAQGGAGHLIDGEAEIVDLEQGELHVSDLTEDGGAHPQRDVVLGDHRLLVTRPGELAHVDLVHPVGQRQEHMESGLVDRLELAEALDDADTALLHHLEAGLQEDHDKSEDRNSHNRQDD